MKFNGELIYHIAEHCCGGQEDEDGDDNVADPSLEWRFSISCSSASVSTLPCAAEMCLQAPRAVVSRATVTNNIRAKKKTITETVVSQNVCGLKSEVRLDELFTVINARNILAACIQETWRSGSEITEYDQCRLITVGLDAGDQCRRGSQGVGIALSARGADAWKASGSVVHQDFGARILAIRLMLKDSQNRDVGLFLVSAYAPVGNADEHLWDEYLENLDRCIARKPANDILLVGADTNSSMGCAERAELQHHLGRFGFKHTNNAGLRFSSYLAINNFVALTTCFRKRQYGTWMHPRSKLPHQIDHFITGNEQFCRFTDAGVTASLLDSDHRAIGCKIRVMARLKKRTPQRLRLLRFDYDSLADKDVADAFCSKVVDTYSGQCESTDSKYTCLATSISIAALKTLPKKQRAQPGWFAAAELQITPLIEKRNQAMEAVFKRNTRLTTRKLREARSLLKSSVSTAKNAWIAKQCSTINNTVGTKLCWDTVSALRRGMSKSRPSAERTMKKPDGSLCSTPAENAEVFKCHFEQLYGQPPMYDESVLELLAQQPTVLNCDHPPTSDEIRRAIGKLKNKAPGESGLTPQAWKVLASNDETFSLLETIILEFWNSEITPTEWENGLLRILPKKGDLSLPGNYRGIMLLEAAYKIVCIILHGRLLPIQERIDHEAQCGFRPGRGCADAVFTVKLAMKKRREHGLESWILFIDLVKAFDRVPRQLLWKVLFKFGVPVKLVKLLEALHAHVNITFTVNDITNTIECIIGVKQGDILGPILFIFYLAAIMITWKATHQRPLCIFHSKADFVLTGRGSFDQGEEFELPDSEYADDTAVLFTSRTSVEVSTPLMIVHFNRFGMSIHVGKPDKTSKSELLFVSAPPTTYVDPDTYDGADLSNIKLGNSSFIPVVAAFLYLGSMLTRDCRDDVDVANRIESASGAFGALRKCIFSSSQISFAAKRAVYTTLILSILLYGSECWCLTEKLYNKLRTFHRRCIRAICRVTRKHTREHRISTLELLRRTGLASIDVYVTRRQLRWAGHVARMHFSRLPRKMLSSWVRSKRPRGAPQYTYGRGLMKSLRRAGVDVESWWVQAEDRLQWRDIVNSVI